MEEVPWYESFCDSNDEIKRRVENDKQDIESEYSEKRDAGKNLISLDNDKKASEKDRISWVEMFERTTEEIPWYESFGNVNVPVHTLEGRNKEHQRKDENVKREKQRIGVDLLSWSSNCRFLHWDYCEKYDFYPCVKHSFYMNNAKCEEACTRKERTKEGYKVKGYSESDIEEYGRKKPTLYSQFYYETERFNKENYEDYLDLLDYFNDKGKQ